MKTKAIYNKIRKIAKMESKLHIEEDNLRAILNKYNKYEIEFNISTCYDWVLVLNHKSKWTRAETVLMKIEEKWYFTEEDIENGCF